MSLGNGNPATLAACGAPKNDLAGALITSKHTGSPLSIQESQALARSVFGREYQVGRPIGLRFGTRAPSRIRSWRAP
jgi:hypothetical protein